MYKKVTPVGDELNAYRQIEDIAQQLKELYKSFGYRLVHTPIFESYDLFSGLEGTISLDEMIKVIDETGNILVMRPDITTPIARLAATSSISSSSKYYYAANVFQRAGGLTGGRNDLLQAGVENLGSISVDADGEVIHLAIRSLQGCGIADFKIDLGHIGYFKGLLRELSLTPQQKQSIRKVVESKQFSELEPLVRQVKGPAKVKEALVALPGLYGAPSQVLQEAKGHICNEYMAGAVDNILEICSVLDDYGCTGYIALDLGLVNHLDYYTGLVFKGYALHYGQAILSGGRYDNLTKQYGRDIPATGFALDVERLRDAIVKDKENQEWNTDYLILYPPLFRRRGYQLADDLRKQGYIVETAGLTEGISRADAKGRNVGQIIVIEEELDVPTGVKASTEVEQPSWG